MTYMYFVSERSKSLNFIIFYKVGLHTIKPEKKFNDQHDD